MTTTDLQIMCQEQQSGPEPSRALNSTDTYLTPRSCSSAHGTQNALFLVCSHQAAVVRGLRRVPPGPGPNPARSRHRPGRLQERGAGVRVARRAAGGAGRRAAHRRRAEAPPGVARPEEFCILLQGQFFKLCVCVCVCVCVFCVLNFLF